MKRLKVSIRYPHSESKRIPHSYVRNIIVKAVLKQLFTYFFFVILSTGEGEQYGRRQFGAVT